MPASTYSQFQDPITGEVIWLPQLYPYATSTGEILPNEMEKWVSTGAIPPDLYASNLQGLQKMEEIHKRIQNGEQVQISELPSEPWALTEYLLKNKVFLYGENVLTRIFSRLDENDPNIVWLSYVKESIHALKATDPLPFHQHISRTILKEKYNIDSVGAVDILARALLEHCCNMIDFKSFQHPAFNKLPIDVSDLHDPLRHKEENILQIDMDFVAYLKKIGPKGAKLASEVQKNSIELFECYEKENYSSSLRRQLWGLWVPDNTPISAVLLLLTQSLWEDRCGKIWNRGMEGTPSLVKPIIDRMIPLLSPKGSKKFIEKEGSIICTHEGRPILTAPAVDANAISAFQKGVKELGTLTGHKMLRWQVNAGFERWANCEEDPRLIKIDGGYSKIAELIGCRSTLEIAKVKTILHAQAFGGFIFQDGSHGNMITINITERHRNQEPSKINIVLGDMLLPSYVCQFQRSERRLIPIGDLPPLHGSGNSHAAQAQLQLLIFSEFSDQSVRLAQEGSIIITMERWKQLAYQAGLDPQKINLVINHWCERDLFNCFLEKQGDEFRLASYYERAHKFLENQGENRLHNSKLGKKSALSKKKVKKPKE